MTMEKTKLIADHLGIEEVVCQLAEESSELAQAALKYRRVLKGTTPVTENQAVANLIEEIADVLGCVDSVMYLMECSGHNDFKASVEIFKDAKMERWYKRTFGTKFVGGSPTVSGGCGK